LALFTSVARAQSEASKVSGLIAVLRQADASQHDKARACQQLGEIGTREAVPALAALLPDQALSAYARSGLEGIPDPSAAEALRSALKRLKGNLLAGVVNSLGVLRDRAAVGELSRLADDPASGVAKEALLALGRISNPEAIGVLRRALRSGSEPRRGDAAAAILIAAEVQMAGGKAEIAVALYDDVSAARVPAAYRMPALRGGILARGSKGTELLLKLMRSDEREIRNVALHTIREIPSEKLAAALNAELAAAAQPELQAQIIEAMADCHNAQSLSAVRAKAESENAEVRQAALKTLGRIGGPGDAPLLLKALSNSRSPAETSAASASLARMEGADVDTLILQALNSSTDGGTRLALVDLLDVRSPLSATSALVKQAADPDLKISMAALRALRSLAGVNELPALIAVTKTCMDGAQRAAAESALLYAATRSSDTTQAGELLLAELKQASADLDKASWIRTLSGIGYSKAMPAVASSLRGANSWLVRTTIESLGRWRGIESLRLLLPYLDDAEMKTAAAYAIVGAAEPLAAQPEYHGVLKPALDRIAEMNEKPLAQRIANLKRIMAESAARPGPSFK
jgi:HEAT repeat protein